MSQLLDQAITALDSSDFDTVQRGLTTIQEVVLVNRVTNFISDEVPAANDEVLAWGPLEVAQKRVMRFIEEAPDGPHVQHAFGVLGCFYDKALRPFFTRWLRRYYDQAATPARVAGQVLMSLKETGVECVTGGSYSNSDFGKNLDDAARYLRDHPNP